MPSAASRIAGRLPASIAGAQHLSNAWLASQGRAQSSFDVVQRLCYVGARGVGALEFQPAQEPAVSSDADLQVDALVRLASEVLAERAEFVAELSANPDEEAMKAILAVGSSAGGARPKAFIAYNDATGEVRSGQVQVGEGFRHWLLKFDGVARAGDHGLADPQGWGAVEYAYSKMARAAGIDMTECRLLEENGRRHFMTRRFDRPDSGDKAAHAVGRRAGARQPQQSRAPTATSRCCC